jgi:2-dehydro-3-deoxyphosphogluconate aldolase/(4S)-4-hydroxy-2-oxoglutarate aldolase
MQLREIMQLAPVIPVITLERAEQALPLAEALLRGGLPVLELTLRTPVALEAISAISREFPEAVVGAGTVLDAAALQRSLDAGARFAVSPGTTPALLQAAAAIPLPLLPGAATASEVMALLERGIHCMKFFPAAAAGGTALLQSLAAPLPQACFCPTGGISLEQAPAWLALPNVACVGGSWMVKAELLLQSRWDEVRSAAAAAAALPRRKGA